MSVRLLEAGPAFAAVFAALHRRCFRTPWSESEFAGMCALPGVAGFLALVPPPAVTPRAARAEAVPVGFICHRVAADEAEILTLGVLGAYRARGIGRSLVRATADAAHRAGAGALFLEVAVGNDGARALYAALGFATVGRRPNYYDPDVADTRDALILKASLPLQKTA